MKREIDVSVVVKKADHLKRSETQVGLQFKCIANLEPAEVSQLFVGVYAINTNTAKRPARKSLRVTINNITGAKVGRVGINTNNREGPAREGSLRDQAPMGGLNPNLARQSFGVDDTRRYIKIRR